MHPAKNTYIRYGILALMTLGIGINYIDRAAVSVALPFISHDLKLSATESGVILSAFFWCYTFFQLPGGYLVDKLGSRIVFTLSSLGWGIATLGTGLIKSIPGLIALRMLLGTAEAPTYPVCSATVTKWFPVRERTSATATYNNGSKIGGTLVIPLVSALIAWTSWRTAFIVIGAAAILWALAWYLYYRDPEHHPTVSPQEKALIGVDAPQQQDNPMTIRQLCANRTVQAMSVGLFCVDFVSYFFFTWFPTYLIQTFHLTLLSFGFIGMLPGIAAIIGGWAGGWLSDGLVRRGASLTKARKIPLVIGLLGSTAIALAAFSPTIVVSMAALCTANFSATLAAAVMWTLPSDVAPSKSNVATIGGIQNMVGNLAGIISPIMVGMIMQATHSFILPLVIAGVIGIVGAITYGIWLPEVKPIEPRTAGVRLKKGESL
ncbi:MFS transporter [Martelella alba]|uniref:MFS transporter n=1 Tax=Martelella alba TaxID=2590451 RepID=A0ABY2SJM6_9HYPH|nr:MFS transporter [Martelella alba]TKI03369.1 MFS transporter [Martelella alba]